MNPTSSLVRRRPTDLISAPISAFESETQAVIQRTTPYSEHAILHVIAGMIVLSLLLMAFVKLDIVVAGNGKILPSAGSIFVQPLDRAIVTGILVHTGDVVKKGQVLATLDPTFAAADLKDLQQKQASSQALVARLTAERADRPFVPDRSSPYQQLQATIWRQRHDEFLQGTTDFDARIRSSATLIDKSRSDTEGYRQRLALAAELEQSETKLRAMGYGSRVKEIADTDNRVEIQRMLAQSQSGIAQTQSDLNSLKAQRAVYVGKWRDDVNTQLVQAQNELEAANQNLAKAQKVSDLSKLTSPEDAVVLKVGQASIGSMVDAQSTTLDPLFTLVPLHGAVEADVHVEAKDIGFIHPGDKVRIKLDAYKFTLHGTAQGVVKTVSEGSFTTDDNGQTVAPFFKVRVLFTDTHLHNVPASFRLVPGMTLSGEMIVGKRTIMSYLIGGALRTGSEAMREPS